jgi:acid phosphatase
MTGPCDTTSHDSYAARHNPWVYFASPASRTACDRYDVPAGTLSEGALHDAIASGTLPDVGLLVPDLCHDGHDCDLGVTDDWLRTWLRQVLAGPDYTAGRLAVVVTFDEDEGRGDVTSEVVTVVVAPGVDHRVVATALDHRSWSRWMTDLVGASPLGDAQRSTSLGDAFGLRSAETRRGRAR